MKSKFAVVALGILALVIIFFAAKNPKQAAAPDIAREESIPSTDNPTGKLETLPATTNLATTNLSRAEALARERYIELRVEDLEALGRKRDADSVTRILSELSNPEKEIRKAAREALIQSGDRSAAPRLQELAAKTEDPEEKKELVEAAYFLELPSLTESRAKWKASAATNTPGDSQFHTNSRIRKPRPPRSAPTTAP